MKAGLNDILLIGLFVEDDGRRFYERCSKLVSTKEGREMFNFLASEESRHYTKFKELYVKHAGKKPVLSDCERTRLAGFRKKADVFVRGSVEGLLDGASDAIDALDIAVEVEENSIRLYSGFRKSVSEEGVLDVLKTIIGEEERHLAILQMEEEFLTSTGEWHDFRIVTS